MEFACFTSAYVGLLRVPAKMQTHEGHRLNGNFIGVNDLMHDCLSSVLPCDGLAACPWR